MFKTFLQSFSKIIKQSGKVKLWDSVFVECPSEARVTVTWRPVTGRAKTQNGYGRRIAVSPQQHLASSRLTGESAHTCTCWSHILALWLVELLGAKVSPRSPDSGQEVPPLIPPSQIGGLMLRSGEIRTNGIYVLHHLNASQAHSHTWEYKTSLGLKDALRADWQISSAVPQKPPDKHRLVGGVTEWRHWGNSRCVRKLDNTEVNTHKDTPFQQEVNRKWSVTGDDSNYFFVNFFVVVEDKAPPTTRLSLVLWPLIRKCVSVSVHDAPCCRHTFQPHISLYIFMYIFTA